MEKSRETTNKPQNPPERPQAGGKPQRGPQQAQTLGQNPAQRPQAGGKPQEGQKQAQPGSAPTGRR